MAMVSEDRNNQRKPYNHQEYPKHVHHEDGVQTKVVKNLDEYNAHLEAGWLANPVQPKEVEEEPIAALAAAWQGCPGPIVTIDGGQTGKCESCAAELSRASAGDIKRMHLQTPVDDQTPKSWFADEDEAASEQAEIAPDPAAPHSEGLAIIPQKFKCGKCKGEGHINAELCKDCNGLGETTEEPKAETEKVTPVVPPAMSMSAENRAEFEQAKNAETITEAAPKVEEAAADEAAKEASTEKADKPKSGRGGKAK